MTPHPPATCHRNFIGGPPATRLACRVGRGRTGQDIITDEDAMARTMLLVLLLLTACSESGRLTYAPSVPASAAVGRAIVAMGAVTDQRDDRSDVIGVIRGGYGNPLKTVHSDQPVPVTVANAFAAALQSRGLLAAGTAPYRLDVAVRQLYADKYHRAE